MPPYSLAYELHFFFAKGLPLGLAAVLSWGVPPLLAMLFAGHTRSSAHLQAALGYGRVWFNCTMLMPTFGLGAYFNSVVPGCIGAGREERIPWYLRRSMLLTTICMLPIYALQFSAGQVMYALGVPGDYIPDISVFCQIMVVNGVLISFSSHLDCVCVNSGYAKCSTLNSLITGLGVDVFCNYTFVFHLGWGVTGAALAQIVVQASRIAVWLACMGHFKIIRKTFSAPRGSERLFSKKELREFFRLGLPMILVFFSGWFIFEFQIMAITDIQGISKDALAAGAVWVQVESSLAAAQDGWIRSTSMRMLNLLGKQDRGAAKAFMVLNALSLAVVVLSNVPFLILQESIARLLSNDTEVQRWLYKLLWVLVPHTVTRILSINFSVFYIPLGRGLFGSLQTFISFYGIAAPIACVVALTNVVTTVELPKMVACVGLSSIAQLASACISAVWLWRLDWFEAGRIIKDRANMDREGDSALERYEGA